MLKYSWEGTRERKRWGEVGKTKMLGGEIVRRGENGEKWGSGEACICAPFRLYLFVWRAHKTLTPSYPQHVLQPVTLPLRFSARGLFLSLSHIHTNKHSEVHWGKNLAQERQASVHNRTQRQTEWMLTQFKGSGKMTGCPADLPRERRSSGLSDLIKPVAPNK